MKIEKTEVYGWRASIIRAMRNPKNSWDKSDSFFWYNSPHYTKIPPNDIVPWNKNIFVPECPFLGPNDIKLAKSLIKGGSEHRKFLRSIMIWVDLSLPRSVWTEVDTYKVSTVRNSCSTMHKMGHSDVDLTDFDFVSPPEKYGNELVKKFNILKDAILDYMNEGGAKYRESKDFNIVRSMKSINPEGFIQKATYTFNYETALSWIRQRKNHRLPEWNTHIMNWLYELPYVKEFTDGI